MLLVLITCDVTGHVYCSVVFFVLLLTPSSLLLCFCWLFPLFLTGVMEVLGKTCLKLIMGTLSRCVSSPHFQISERMLFLWNNQYLTSSDALLGTTYTKEVLPLVIGALTANAGSEEDVDTVGESGHWNPTVKQLTNSVIKMYSKGDVKLYDSILANHMKLTREKDRIRLKNDARWKKLDSGY